jgi:hypothetical protein
MADIPMTPAMAYVVSDVQRLLDEVRGSGEFENFVKAYETVLGNDEYRAENVLLNAKSEEDALKTLSILKKALEHMSMQMLTMIVLEVLMKPKERSNG